MNVLHERFGLEPPFVKPSRDGFCIGSYQERDFLDDSDRFIAQHVDRLLGFGACFNGKIATYTLMYSFQVARQGVPYDGAKNSWETAKNMLSKTAEYALRAVTFLAEREACDTMASSADAISEGTKVPRRYLNRVLQDLVAAELIESRCGPRGGYKLAKPTDAITILDVVNAVSPLSRITTCPLGLKSHTSLCPLHAELDRAYAATEAAFAGFTMKQLLDSTSPIVPLVESQ